MDRLNKQLVELAQVFLRQNLLALLSMLSINGLSHGPQYSRTKALNDTIRRHVWTQSPILILD
jgi:hypothetical protein